MVGGAKCAGFRSCSYKILLGHLARTVYFEGSHGVEKDPSRLLHSWHQITWDCA